MNLLYVWISAVLNLKHICASHYANLYSYHICETYTYSRKIVGCTQMKYILSQTRARHKQPMVYILSAMCIVRCWTSGIGHVWLRIEICSTDTVVHILFFAMMISQFHHAVVIWVITAYGPGSRASKSTNASEESFFSNPLQYNLWKAASSHVVSSRCLPFAIWSWGFELFAIGSSSAALLFGGPRWVISLKPITQSLCERCPLSSIWIDERYFCFRVSRREHGNWFSSTRKQVDTLHVYSPLLFVLHSRE